jgi:hypothetical protein
MRERSGPRKRSRSTILPRFVGLVCGVLHDRLRDEPVVEGGAVVHRQPREHQQMFGADAILTAAPRAGRPTADPRARLDAIFRAVTLKHPAGGRACLSRWMEPA